MMKMPRALSARFRRAHPLVVPLAAAPLLLTAASGSLYSLLLERGIDAFWLIKIHTGRFGPINLQPYYSLLLGALTLVVIDSGVIRLRAPLARQVVSESLHPCRRDVLRRRVLMLTRRDLNSFLARHPGLRARIEEVVTSRREMNRN